MTSPAWCFAALLAVAVLGWFLFTVVLAELDRRTAERDRLAASLRTVRGQRDLADAERAALQARLDDPSRVLPFGPVQRGLVARVPRQRNGEGA